ncbi:hypothetical protein FJZ17_02910 [Candidatus Pacearchaeota archaeon]|nr:hypothetical protein [Candidatus Pacearchaeota archaeon]
MVQILLLNILLMLTAIPVGWFLAWLCKDEIVYRKWFYILFYLCLALILLILILKRPIYELLTCIYFIILLVIALIKGKDKKFLNLKK